LPTVSSPRPRTENTRSTYASDAELTTNPMQEEPKGDTSSHSQSRSLIRCHVQTYKLILCLVWCSDQYNEILHV